jgi:hypothetical protein
MAMKHMTGIIIFVLALAACKQPAHNKKLADLKPDFKYNNLKAFSIDSFEWGTRANHYKALDSLSHHLIWQGPNNPVYNSNGYDRSFLYAWQERDKKFQECAILTELESDNGPAIVYCIFDKNGKAVDHFIAAADCMDGGWSYESYGRFVKPDVYEATCIEQAFVEMDSTNNKEIYKGDTTVLQYTIGNNGKVSQKQMYKKAFSVRE